MKKAAEAACDRTFLLAFPLAASSGLDKNDYSQPFLLTPKMNRRHQRIWKVPLSPFSFGRTIKNAKSKIEV